MSRDGQRWLPGEHEAVSCTTKLRYRSAGEAGRAKEAIKRRRHFSTSTNTLNAYRCDYCGGCHLGRPQKKKHLKHRRRGQHNYMPPDEPNIW